MALTITRTLAEPLIEQTVNIEWPDGDGPESKRYGGGPTRITRVILRYRYIGGEWRHHKTRSWDSRVKDNGQLFNSESERFAAGPELDPIVIGNTPTTIITIQEAQ